MARSRWLSVATWFVATRLIIYALGVVGVGSFINQRTGQAVASTAALNPATAWQQWDAVWYEEIARQGYGTAAEDAHRQATAAYFPLYPLAVGAVLKLAPSASFFAVGALVSNLFALGALLLLARSLITTDDQLQRVLAVVLLSAGSFYLSIPYAESLFLLLVVAAMMATRRRQYEVAGLLAGLSATTRVYGLPLIAVPVLACWLDQALPSGRRWARAAAAIVLFAMPVVAYMAFLNNVQGSWFAFLSRQELWENPSPVPFQAIAGLVRHPTRMSGWLHGGFWLLYVGLLVRYWRRLPVGEALFCLGVLLITTQQDGFQGTYRYMLTLLPLSLALADDRSGVRHGVLALNIAFGVLMILAFVTHNRLTV